MDRRQFLSSTTRAAAGFLIGANPLPGRRTLTCHWQSRKNKSSCYLRQSNEGPFQFTELYVNGVRQTLARYPNPDPSNPAGGAWLHPLRGIPAGTSSPDPGLQPEMPTTAKGIVGLAFDPETFTQRHWSRPEEAIVHLYSSPGGPELKRRIRFLDYDRNLIWFDYRDSGQVADDIQLDAKSRFYIDNVSEEMDVPGEWYLSQQSETLYFRAPSGLDLEKAAIEIPA
jgi:hypothetical protein